MEFAFNGTVPPELAEFRVGLEAALLRRGYAMLGTPDDATLVCNFVDATDARPYRRTNKWTSSRPSGTRGGARRLRAHGLPGAAEGPVEPLGVCRPGCDGAVSDARAGQLRGPRRRRSRHLLRPRRRAPRAARGVEPGDREHLDARPRARAVGRRRDHGLADGGRRAAREAEPAPGAVADRRDPLGARPRAREAAVLDRRPVVRQPLGAQGSDTASG